MRGVTAIQAVFAGMLACVVLPGCVEEDPQFELPGTRTSLDAEGAFVHVVTQDRVALCDNARAGTPCGERGSDKHCIAQVCIENLCGDGVEAGDEECDDGNQLSRDGCDATCHKDTAVPRTEGKAGSTGGGKGGSGGQGGKGASAAGGRVSDQAGTTSTGSGGNSTSGEGGSTAGSESAGASGGTAGEGGAGTDGAIAGVGGLAGMGGAGSDGAIAGVGGMVAVGPTWTPSQACTDCRQLNCRQYKGQIDAVGGCLERVDPTFGADVNDASFNADCKAVVECAVANGCAQGLNGVTKCYCGSPNISACSMTGPTSDAKCVAEIERAVRAPSTPSSVISQIRSLDAPMGWAFDLLDCDATFCRDTCK